MPRRSDRFLCGVTYFPATVGPFLWHEFEPRTVEQDVAAIRRAGFGVVRVLLSWDAFMPTHRAVSRSRMRDFEILLTACRLQDLTVVPVLFGQSLGDSIMLPAYAVDRSAPRRGVRVLTDGVVQAGGPRDIWADPLMLEVQHVWLETMLGGFANHPALAAWDLGHDPATTVRPRRTAHLERWLEVFATRVRATGDPVWLTLDADDVLTARATRVSVVAPHVDAVGLQLFARRLGLTRDGDAHGAAAFTVQLAQRMCGDDTPVIVHTAHPTARDDDTAVAGPATRHHPGGLPWDVALTGAADAAHDAAAEVDSIAAVGAAGAIALSWSDWGPRTRAAAPGDLLPSFTRLGLVDELGDAKAVGEAWFAEARRERATSAAQPWPEHLDARDYFANLPESARDLYARWRGRFR